MTRECPKCGAECSCYVERCDECGYRNCEHRPARIEYHGEQIVAPDAGKVVAETPKQAAKRHMDLSKALDAPYDQEPAELRESEAVVSDPKDLEHPPAARESHGIVTAQVDPEEYRRVVRERDAAIVFRDAADRGFEELERELAFARDGVNEENIKLKFKVEKLQAENEKLRTMFDIKAGALEVLNEQLAAACQEIEQQILENSDDRRAMVLLIKERNHALARTAELTKALERIVHSANAASVDKISLILVIEAIGKAARDALKEGK